MTVESICILRLSAIGDVTHVLPVIHCLKQSRPDAKITWIIGKLEYQLVSDLAGIEFIVFDKSRGYQEFLDLRNTLRGRRFDVLLHMQVALRANLLSLVIPARRRIGYDRKRSKDLHGLFINERIAEHSQQHVLDVLRSFLQPLGIDPFLLAPQWHIPLSDNDRHFAREYIDADRPTLVISPVSSRSSRDWLPERYAAVADQAIEMLGFQVIFSSGPAQREKAFVHSIEVEMQHTATNLAGMTTLKQSAALLGAADLLLAPDTGPAHIANAMGTEVIGLYAASNPCRTGPYNSLPWCVDYYAEAARIYKGQSADTLKWGTRVSNPGVMELIPVSAVIDKLTKWCTKYTPAFCKSVKYK